MKKITKTVACLLFAIHTSAQSDVNPLYKDSSRTVVCKMVKGKCFYTFDYDSNQRLEEYDICYDKYQEINYYINEGEILVIDLYDKGDRNQLLFRRKITIYFRDGSVSSFYAKSKNDYLFFDGNDIYEVTVSKPIL